MTEGKLLTVKLALVAICPSCNQPRAVKSSGKCPACETILPEEDVKAVRAAVRSRRQAFKVRLGRLADRMHTATDRPLIFATRGVPESKADYLHEIARPAVNAVQERHVAVAQLLATGEWVPTSPGCIGVFTELVRLLDAEMDFITQFTRTMPPLELRGVHRELTRGAAQFVRSHVFTTQTICAVDADEAAELGVCATDALTTAQKHLARATNLFNLIERSPSPDPFRADGSLDIAALAWSTVNLKTTSIADAAHQVRNAFAEMPDMAALPDHRAALLLPLLAVGAGVIDPETLTLRVQELRSVIDGAGPPSVWVVDPLLLVDRVVRGVDRIAEETERLAREAKYGLPRHHVLRTEIEMYRTLVEGALRDLGGIVLVAARARRGEDNGAYETAVIDGIMAGEIVSELDSMGGPCGGAVNMLYRNASAHGDVEITDTGIRVIERRIKDKREIWRDPQSPSDAEFAEDLVALQEVLLALELAVLPWLWSTADPGLSAAIDSAPVTQRQREQTIALLGGIAGLYDVSFSANGHHATIAAASHHDETDRRESSILSLVPGGFGLSPDIQEVSLHIEGLRPVLFERAEFLEIVSDDTPHKLPMLGLTTAKWLLESGSVWSERDEATYVTFPLTMAYFACWHLIEGTPPIETIDQAVSALRLALSRLDDVFPEAQRSALTCQAVSLARTLATSLTGLAESRRGHRSPAEGERLAKEAVATLQPMYEIQERAKALRDASLDSL